MFALVVFAGALLAIWWFVLRPSEEGEIRERFSELTELVSEPLPEGVIAKARILGGFRDLFADPVAIDSDSAGLAGLYSPDKLTGIYFSALRSGAVVKILLKPGRIELPETGVARVEAVVSATVTKASGTRQEESGRMRVELREIDGDWKFASFVEAGP